MELHLFPGRKLISGGMDLNRTYHRSKGQRPQVVAQIGRGWLKYRPESQLKTSLDDKRFGSVPLVVGRPTGFFNGLQMPEYV